MESGVHRSLPWDGLLNGRDLGGIPTSHGAIEPRRLVRSASVHTLSGQGWHALVDHGIRTVIDLRHGWEIEEASTPAHLRRSEVEVVAVPLEPPGYIEAWSTRADRWKLTTPLYYHEFLAEHGHRVGTVLAAIAGARPGGVLLHCYSGRDRVGLSIAMLLDLLGVDHDIIAADHWLSFDRPRSVEADLGKAESPGKPTPDRGEYATIISDVLSTHPAPMCFAELAAADEIRSALVARLCIDSAT